MMKLTSIKRGFSKIEEIINTYGFISSYRLEKLNIDYNLPSFSFFGKIEKYRKEKMLELVVEEYKADRMSENEFKEIKNLLKK